MTDELDKEFEQPVYSEVCLKCRHFNREAWTDDDRRTCPAFPEGIPDEIWRGDNNHQAPFEGDNGIQFEARDADQSEDDVDE